LTSFSEVKKVGAPRKNSLEMRLPFIEEMIEEERLE
jgi:hypothetical protein